MESSTVESARDYISDLPHSMIENILMRLPIKDAVRTCVLSTKWRHRWAAIRHLVLDIGPYTQLRVIELYQVHFEDVEEITMVLRLITNSPNLTEIVLSGSSNTLATVNAPRLDFWEKECHKGCTFKQLRTIKMTDISGIPHEMEFIRFLLANSPVLEDLSITTCVYDARERCRMWNKLLKFGRASSKAKIIVIDE